MNDQMLHWQGIKLRDGKLRTEGNKHYYRAEFATQSLNSKAFHISPEVIASMVEQAKDLPIFLHHRTYSNFPSGRSVDAQLNDGKAMSEFYIQRLESDPESQKVIELLDGKTLTDTSLGGVGGDFYCDIDHQLMEPKVDWFWVNWQCENGHTLGRHSKIEGEKKLVTAQLRGEFTLKEFSLVGIGADPNAKILEYTKQELGNGNLLPEDLAFIAETTNINLSQFCTNLGLSLDNIPTLGGPPPEPTKRIFDMSANLSTDVKVLQDLNTELQTNNTKLSTENAELKVKIAEFEQRIPVLEQQAQDGVNLKSELEKSKQSQETLKKDADNYKTYKASAIEQAMTNFRNYLGLSEIQAVDNVACQMKQKELNAMESIESIVTVSTGYLGMTHEKNSGGRKSQDSPPGVDNSDEDVFFSGMNII